MPIGNIGQGVGYNNMSNARVSRNMAALDEKEKERQLLLKMVKDQYLKKLALQKVQNESSFGLDEKKAEFNRDMGLLQIQDVNSAATANMWNNILAGAGQAAGTYMQMQQQKKYQQQMLDMLKPKSTYFETTLDPSNNFDIGTGTEQELNGFPNWFPQVNYEFKRT